MANQSGSYSLRGFYDTRSIYWTHHTVSGLLIWIWHSTDQTQISLRHMARLSHYWGPPYSAWYVHTQISPAPGSVGRAMARLVHHLDPPYSVWLVSVCWASQKHSSPSVALCHAVQDWNPPSAVGLGWIYWTSALLLKWVMLSQLVTLQLKESVSAGLVILPNSVV